MRPEIAASLLNIQAQLGDDLGGALEGSADTTDGPHFRHAIALEHIGGMHAGGSFPLDVGSYRFGRSSGSVMLDAGEPQVPQFGLTIDPDGIVTLYPPTHGLRVDGGEVMSPTTIRMGQVIIAGHDRFELSPQERLVSRRGSSNQDEPLPAMPAPAKSRHADTAIVQWARSARDRELRDRRASLAGPTEIHRRIDRGELFDVVPGDPSFGVAAVVTAELIWSLPAESFAANRPTQDALEALAVLPGIPLGVDLKQQSLAIVGPRAMGRAVAMWLAVSLTAQASARDLGITLRSGGASGSSWSWLSGLPHSHPDAGGALRVTIVDETTAVDTAEPGSVVLFEPSATVPASFGAVLTITADSASIEGCLDGAHHDDVSPIGLSSAVALERSLVIAEQHIQGGAR